MICIIYVFRRTADANQVAQKLSQLGAKVDLFERNDSGNAFFTGKLSVKNGSENYSALITKTVQEIEFLTADSLSQK